MKEKLKSLNKVLKKEYYIREIVTLFVMVVSLLGFVVYESLSIFEGTVEKTSAAQIIAGSLTFTVTCTNEDCDGATFDQDSGQITVPANQEVYISLTVTNTTEGVGARYRVYYKPISPSTLPSEVTVGISSLSPYTVSETLTQSGTEANSKVVRIGIQNTSTQSVTIQLGVEGGYETNSTVTLSSGNIAVSTTLSEQIMENAPVLAQGLIPVVYDEDNDVWEVADTSTKWYNYSEQKWANAVTTSSSTYRTASAGTEIPMDDINSMWVWIPRYKYRIPSNIGSSSSNVTSPPEIDVVFESGTETTGETLSNCPIDATDCYYTHPVFTYSIATTEVEVDKELTGIWVGKFETSGSATAPTIKPDVSSLRSQTVSEQFQTSLKFAGGSISAGKVTFSGNDTYGLTSSTDTHMMKNTEWGAVAYLSQSKYGKYGNSNYTVKNKEIYINNSSSFYTGRSGGNVGGSTPINGTYTDQTSTAQYNKYGFYTYNDYLLDYNTNTKGEKVTGKGTGASTTGTIYGIYDMSGGAYEYTMSNWAGYSGYSSSSNSGFTGLNYDGTTTSGISFPNPKYYDKYTGTSSNSITKEKSIKGDATYETMHWYSDDAFFVCANGPWALRGGNCDSGSTAGVFNSNYNVGLAYSSYSFRAVLVP